MLAEDALSDFVVARAAREDRQVLDWRAEAADRARWSDISRAFAAHAAGVYSHTFRAVRGDTDGA